MGAFGFTFFVTPLGFVFTSENIGSDLSVQLGFWPYLIQVFCSYALIFRTVTRSLKSSRCLDR